MAKTKRGTKGTYAVEMECVVRKVVICCDCTEEEARNDPWAHAEDETETDQLNWEVVSVTEEK